MPTGLSGRDGPVRPGAPESDVWSVSELNRRVRDLFLEAFGPVRVEGELSGVRYYRSGGRERVYGTLKDAGAEVRIVLWEETVASLRFRLEDGQQVEVVAEVTLYPQRGQYQLVVRQLRPAGIGELELAFQQLKERLEREGLFAPERKRALPLRPFRVGVVTSLQAAALEDFLQITRRRNPALRILVAPARVQGEGAAVEIVAALEALQRVTDLDCVVLTRGGGSLEDLWPFNEEVVARAVAACRLPVVSAVGHETDWTICDLVADLRMPTPSAAAEQVAWSRDEVAENIGSSRERIQRVLERRLGEMERQVRWFGRAHGFLQLRSRLREAAQQCDEALRRLPTGLLRRFEQSEEQNRVSGRRLRKAADTLIDRRALRLVELGRTMKALGPTAVLERGYAIVRHPPGGAVVRSARGLEPGTPLEVYLPEGRADVRVERTGPGLEGWREAARERPGGNEET